jgi:hypothetical protein
MSKVKIYVMRSFNATINGRSQHFEEGTEAEMSRDHANDYVRAGFISLVGERPAVKVVQKPGRKRKKAVK